jgi:hypothetical protein
LFRFLLAAFFILHGLVHLLWFVVPWCITTVDGLPVALAALNFPLRTTLETPVFLPLDSATGV